MRGHNRKLSAGTTLVEMLVSIAFLAIAVAPILSLINQSQTRANDTRQRMIALGLAQNELEKLKSQTRTGGANGGQTKTSATPTGALNAMTITTDVVPVVGLKEVYDLKVEVVYDDRGRTVTLATRIKS